MSDADRFWAKVLKTETCWLWTGALTGHGYRNFWLDGRNRPAHRAAYEWLVGPVPNCRELDHLCRVRRCVRPDHLEPVAHRENLMRGETEASRRAAQTHCVHGHEFTPANTSVKKNGQRQCRRCDADQHNARNRARRTVVS